VQALFHEILEQVFRAKPDDPLKFVVEELQEKLASRDATAETA
jgi:hypothetical protein